MKRLLIIRMSALGDVAMLVPVVQELVKEYPSLAVDVLSKPYMSCLFAGLGERVRFISDVHSVDANAYDLVADMHSVLRSHLLSAKLLLHGTKVRHLHKGRVSKRLLVMGMRSRSIKQTICRYVDVLERLGLPITLPEPVMGDGARHGLGVAPFAAHQGKIYPIAKMERVVAMLAEALEQEEHACHGEKILLFGAGEKEKTILDAWAAKYPGVVSMVGRMTMGDEIEEMRHLRLMLTMDSGNMHLASIAGTRVISIWGATHPDAGFLGWGQQRGDCIGQEMACRPCSVYGNKPCRKGDYACMMIDEKVIVKRILERLEQ